MSIRDIGPLQGADEGLNHQIVDTFATIAHSDYAWTEKIWVSIAKADGSIQATLGLGKYTNRGVIDGFGGVSRGREQWTVRGSRELRSAPEETAIGPIVYEVVDPLGAVRVRLEPNDVQPISFDLVLRGVTPPFFEERNLVRNPKTNRIDVNVIRYHQGGWATGDDHRRRGAVRARRAKTGSASATTRGVCARAWATIRPTCRRRRRRRDPTPTGAG